MNGIITEQRKILCETAHFAFGIVNDFLSRDQRLASSLRSNKTVSKQVIREETITEDLNTRLKFAYSEIVDITLFTQPEEGQIGADWYWRIDRGTDAIHARVQAKRVQRREFHDPDDMGYIKINRPQLDRLLRQTKKAAKKLKGLEAWFAIYARFEAHPPCKCALLQSCNRHHHSGQCGNEQPSLWIAEAKEIDGLRNLEIPIEEIIQHSLRLDCLLPCIGNNANLRFGQSDVSGPEQKGFVLNRNLYSYEDCVGVIENDQQLRSQFKGALRIHL